MPTKKITPKKQSKKRASKYEEKLALNGTFEDVMKVLVNPKQPIKKK